MLKPIWTVLCKESVIREDNSISLRDVLENLNIDLTPSSATAAKKSPFPFDIPLSFEVVSYLFKDSSKEESATIRLEVIKPDGAAAKSFEQKFSVPAEKDRFRYIFKIEGLTIEAVGEYIFRLYLQEDAGEEYVVAEVPLKVNVAIAGEK